MKTEGPLKAHGLSIAGSVLFVVGEMAGSGVLSLSKAVANIGWVGVAVIILSCINSGIAGVYLGKCWLILEERWSEYEGIVRYPYPAIGERACGKWASVLVSITVNVAQLGASVVLLLLCSENISSLLHPYWPGGTVCIWLVLIAALFCPLTFFGSPKDFWFTGLAAFLSTVVGTILAFTAVILDTSKPNYQTPPYDLPSFESIFRAFGTILFAFGGAATFPTFQNDMKDRTKFPMAVTLGFTGLLLIYVPLATAGYVAYGSNVADNLLNSISGGPINYTVKILLAVHFFFGALIMFNPTAQEVEEVLRIPSVFTWKRCANRATLVVIVLFVGLSLPSFGQILNLIGGLLMTLTTFIFPAIFYMRLCDQHQPGWPLRIISKVERIYLIAITVLGVVGTVIITYLSCKDILTSFETHPCYIDWARTR